MKKNNNNAESKNTHLEVNSNNTVETQKSPLGKRSSALANLGVFFGSLVGLLFIFMSFTATAQPLPPSTPYGSPVPVGGAIVLLLAMAGFGIKQLMKRRNK